MKVLNIEIMSMRNADLMYINENYNSKSSNLNMEASMTGLAQKSPQKRVIGRQSVTSLQKMEHSQSPHDYDHQMSKQINDRRQTSLAL